LQSPSLNPKAVAESHLVMRLQVFHKAQRSQGRLLV
jgi:hypothetical protein